MEVAEILQYLNQNRAIPVSLFERNAMVRDEADAYQEAVYNKTYERLEIWNGFVWVGSGDIVCSNANDEEVGLVVYSDSSEEIGDMSLPVVKRVGSNKTRVKTLGVISYQNPDSNHCTVSGMGLCYVKNVGAVLVGNQLAIEYKKNGGGVKSTNSSSGTIGVAVENQFSDGLVLTKLSTMVENK